VILLFQPYLKPHLDAITNCLDVELRRIQILKLYLVKNQKYGYVVLSFDPYQGKYMKTQKLHSSQKILIDNETEFRVQLKVYIAFDLVKELLSYGSDLKVIEPLSLINQIKEAHKAAFERYSY